MRTSLILITLMASQIVCAQEASSGFEVRTTLSASAFDAESLTKPPRNGSEATGGFRAVLYPTWKWNSHWTLAGVVQVQSRPYTEEDFSTEGYEVRGDLLQLNLSYAHFWSHNRSFVFRVGQLASGFGSFTQRYDSAINSLVGIPAAYGYYYKAATLHGLVGAEVDVTAGKFDGRLQFLNSSPANPQKLTDTDQYGEWVAGAGYTIRQGLRVGGSAYYGPYLDRDYPFFFNGEANPKTLPALGLGLEAEWGWGHWNVWGEVQHFKMEYREIPNFTQNTGYAEVRRVLSPRWYVAGRVGYLRANAFAGSETYEFAAGFRPDAHQLIKFDYLIRQGLFYPGTSGNVAAIEYVVSFRPISITRD